MKILRKFSNKIRGLNVSLHRRYLERKRPGSEPFVSGDTFRGLAATRFDKPEDLQRGAEAITENSLVFCAAPLFGRFVAEICRNTEKKFFVIVHNGDDSISPDLADKVPPNVLHVFAQNLKLEKPGFTPLPIGLENAWYYTNGRTSDYTRIRKLSVAKNYRIIDAFSTITNPTVREPVRTILADARTCDSFARMDGVSYRKLAPKYAFVASPPGNGEDCHRTWEAMYSKSIPIVQRSFLTEYFQLLGLPMLLVSDYSEVLEYSEDDLRNIYRQNEQKFTCPALWFPFWRQVIEKEMAKYGAAL